MKIFEAIVLNFKINGIYWPQKYKKHPFNLKNLTILFISGLYALLAVLFLLIDAKTFTEYADSFYLIATTIFCPVIFNAIVLKTPEVFDLINSFEEIIQKRKFYCKF